jgi:hypothetical protein
MSAATKVNPAAMQSTAKDIAKITATDPSSVFRNNLVFIDDRPAT